MVITAHYYVHHAYTKDFRKVSTTLHYPKCWVVTTSGIAGLQGNSIRYHTLDNGTQKVLARLLPLWSMMLTTPGEGYMILGVP